MAWFLVTHNTMKVIVSIFRTAYSTFSFLCCDLFWSILLHQQPVLVVPQQSYFVTEWPVSLFSHYLWILTVPFLLLWKKYYYWQLLLLLAVYTSYMHSYTCTCIYGHVKMRSFFHPLVHKLTFTLKKIWKMRGNAWLAFDLISPMTAGVNYHMIFLPSFLDGVNFLLKDDLSFKK